MRIWRSSRRSRGRERSRQTGEAIKQESLIPGGQEFDDGSLSVVSIAPSTRVAGAAYVA
jgi:hypothetical protein